MKKLTALLVILLFFISINADGQTYTQTYVDKCTGEIKIATTTYTNGFATVSFYNQVKTFTPFEVQSGAVQLWLNATYAAYSSLACQTNPVVQQTVQTTVNQATAQAANSAASAAASAASSAASAASSTASSAASSAASSSASSAASSSASSASSSAASSASSGASTSASSTPPANNTSSSSSTSSSSGSSSSSSSNSSSSSSSSDSKSNSSSSSSEQKSESKTESKSESKSESKTEEKKEETKSESKEEKKEESKSEEKKEEKKEESKKEEKKDEKKDDKKKEDKKKSKVQVGNPMILSSDLAGMQSPDKKVSMMMSVGVSKSSLMGDKSYSATALIWSTLDQYAVSGGMTKMDFQDGKLNGIHSYSATLAYLKGTYMAMQGYTYIKPDPKYGTYGFNAGLIHLLMRNMENTGYEYSLMTSFVGFWTKPYQINKKTTLSPQVFVMNSPISYNTFTQATRVNRSPNFILGTGYDYKLSKRFGFSASYKAIVGVSPEFSLLHNIQIGSKLSF